VKLFKYFILALLIVVVSCGFVFGQGKKSKKKISRPKTPAASVKEVKKDMPADIQSDTQNAGFQTLAQNSARIPGGKPFIYVARTRESYEILKGMAELSSPAEIDFAKFAVVAAFLGAKPTGGYAVSIAGHTLNDMYIGARVKISAIGPKPGQIVTDALTSPFKAVLIPVDEEKTLELEIGDDWKNSAEVYTVASGNFEFSGGFAFVQRKFDIGGRIYLWRGGDLITCAFDLAGKGTESGRRLSETVTGKLAGDNSVRLSPVDPGGFVNNPRPALQMAGTLDDQKLSLKIKSLQTHWSDGFEGQGFFQAFKENCPSKKMASSLTYQRSL
jgi:hypothetical protein